MNVGIYFETSKSTGGAHHQNISLIQIFNTYLKNNFDFTYIVPNQEQKKIVESKGSKCIIFKKGVRFRIEQFILKFKFFRTLYKKFSIKNSFESFLQSRKFDLIFFNAPYEISTLINETNFIIMLLSMQHRTHGFFPEYKGKHDNETRDHIIDHAVKNSFKIFVGSEKDKNLLIELFNAEQNKIKAQSYAFNLPSVYEKNKNFDFEKTYKNLDIPQNKNILIYPAQFWAHKNHQYIIDIALDLKKTNTKDIFFVFCGFDKGNLKIVKNKIKKYQLEEYIKIFNYLDDLELISLYLKCFGVIMPSFIGYTTIPMYEAFYFKKNIFYTKGLSDKKLQSFLTEIDINNINSFKDRYSEVLKNKKENDQKLIDAKKFYDEYCDSKNTAENFKKVFDEYKFYKKTWS